MRLMGIDYGTKRVGVALSSEDGTMAFPHATFENKEGLVGQLATLCMKEQVAKVVVGQSHDLNDEPNPLQEKIDAFVDELRARTGLDVVQQPEQFSTQAAIRTQGRTAGTDASAAALILDSYITQQRNHT